MLRIKKINEIIGKNVFTSEGDFFGQVDDVNLVDNKIDGWKIKVGSGFLTLFGGARGVIIPHQFVKAIGDVIIVNKQSLPAREEAEFAPEEELTAQFR
ncbi:MAG: PRC-barrel domain-containing protein [Nanoarchaeota archaeon]